MSTLSITVAVLTFRRPELLAGLLPMLLDHAERLEAAFPGRFAADVLVIDNDPAGSARATVLQYTDQPTLRYVNEPRPGISAARNRALAESADRDALVFIDDDERPSPDWLRLMVQTWQQGDCAAVTGAVRSSFDRPLDPWIQAGDFFTRPSLPTGTPVTLAGAGNLLLDLRRVRELGLTFDEDFGLTGGEDTLFTATLTSSGSAIHWCNEAVVADPVPAHRATRRWVLRRATRAGNSTGRVRIRVADGPAGRAAERGKLLGEGVIRIAGGLSKSGAGVVRGSLPWRAQGLRTAARGLGLSTAAFGYTHYEYRR